MKAEIQRMLQKSIKIQKELQNQVDIIQQIADVLIETLRMGKKILICGNGGSAADAQHMAGELVGRFLIDRPPYRAIALTTDTSTLTALANDYGYESVFSRQVDALADAGDALIALSTSGNSPNILQAVESAKALGAATIGLSGQDGGKLKEMADVCLCVAADDSPSIQEGHGVVIHILCALIEQALSG
jgi:D-sedoheptulose 7-phosphate isomerase